ncbi:MAG: PQQ-dependent sugar dehydrogenase [Alphaproteobacteria bacterium]
MKPIFLPFLFAFAGAAFAAGEQDVGTRFDIRPDRLSRPYATPSVSNSPETISRPANSMLKVPAGFSANLFADGLEHPRWLAVAGNGDVFLAESDAGKITLLRDANGDGRAESRTTYAEGFDRPHGMAIRNGYFYVADTEAVWRFPYKDSDRKAAKRTRLTTQSFGSGWGHWTRNIAFDSKGRLFIAIGSRSNKAEEEAPRATVQVFDNGRMRTFASGLRNPVGIAFYPGTDTLYVAVNERDGLGDGLVPDYLTHVVAGGFYGWPFSYIGKHPDPDYGKKRPDLVAKSITPDLLFEAHSAALGLVFYTAGQFPASYKGDAFVALHGSWNSAKPIGYKVVHVPFKNGKPEGGYYNFAVGFWAKGKETAQVWGRPVGLAVAKDGSLLVADDAGRAVWRIAYTRK